MSDCVIIIPTYNEKENVERMIRKVFSLSPRFNILIVDDGSPDGTAVIVQTLQQQFSSSLHLIQRQGKLGLGTAYITGFKWALQKGYTYIFEMDCDFSHNPDDLLRLLNACENEGGDMSVGSRYVRGGNVKNWPKDRVLLSYFASVYVRIITFMPVKDTTAGFVCYTNKVLQSIDFEKIKFIGYAFQIEMKFAIWRLGYTIKEVPITFVDRIEGVSKMSTGIFKEAFLGVITMRFNTLRARKFYKKLA